MQENPGNVAGKCAVCLLGTDASDSLSCASILLMIKIKAEEGLQNTKR